jgi:Flp pilus assembly protein TadB
MAVSFPAPRHASEPPPTGSQRDAGARPPGRREMLLPWLVLLITWLVATGFLIFGSHVATFIAGAFS